MIPDPTTPDSLAFLTLGDLIRASNQLQAQSRQFENDQPLLVVRLLAINAELGRRAEHLNETALEMSHVMEELERDELADGRIRKAIQMFDEGRY